MRMWGGRLEDRKKRLKIRKLGNLENLKTAKNLEIKDSNLMSPMTRPTMRPQKAPGSFVLLKTTIFFPLGIQKNGSPRIYRTNRKR
jgi:hypothetical protein